ncbi:MAG: hypothetical protein OXE96_13415 [Gemmatimonadetes bacterium]|nr:hypothetical protein [Gemmatimonadota bacterium]
MNDRSRGWMRALPVIAVVVGTGCDEVLPTASSDDLIQGGVAVEVTLPFTDFGTRARVYGGYGRASELAGGFIAHDFGTGPDGLAAGERGLEAATLLRFGRYPGFVSVTDTAGTNRPDSSLTFLSGRIVARLDTLSSILSGPVEVIAHAITEPWDGPSATWEFAVDSVGLRVPWSLPGGGVVEEIGSGVWDPEAGDTLSITVDSARVASWADTADLSRGVRLTTRAPGVRLQMRSALLWLETLPSINPDTIVQVLADTEATSFIYDPIPKAPDNSLRVGGAPAWRTVLDLDPPRVLHGPPELCDVLGCPLEISPEQISYAGLRLTTLAESPAFAPSDTLTIDIRMVTVPDILPKSPLGPPTTGFAGVVLAPEWFSPPAGHVVEVPVTGLVRDLLRGETPDGDPVSNTVALLSRFEPLSIEYVSFSDERSADAPRLRLILNFPPGSGGGG